MCDLLDPTVPRKRATPAAPSTAEALFRLGSIYATPGALALLERHGTCAATLLVRHQSGDFGQVGADSIRDNQQAIQHGNRILSVYRLLDDAALERMTPPERRRSPQVWIITEADRSVTTLLLPEDY